MPVSSDVSRPQSTPAAARVAPNFSDVAIANNHGDVTLNYSVKAGDTLSKIGRKFGTDTATLMQLNAFQVEDADKIKVGQSLVLPTTFYVVKAGDTYSKIGREFGIDPRKLMALNDADSDLIKVGQTLQVPLVSNPETTKVRSDIKALVSDMAKAEGDLYFGPNSFSSNDTANWFHISGPAESGRSYEFSNDYKSVKVWDASGEDNGVIPVRDAESFRSLLISDVMTGVLESRAQQSDEQNPDMRGQFGVTSGPTVKDGKISFVIDEPLCHDAEVVYDSKTGKLSYTNSATGEPQTVNAGKNPSEVATALARLLRVKVPMYNF